MEVRERVMNEESRIVIILGGRISQEERRCGLASWKEIPYELLCASILFIQV